MALESTTAVILAGGKGTRLHPYTMSIPKPLLPLGDVSILEIVLRQLAQAGVRRMVLTLGHMAHLFQAFVGNGERWGLEIEYFSEDVPLGTAGSLRQLTGLSEDFLVMNGDLLTDLDFRQLVEEHRRRQAWATIATHRREVKIDYGVIEMKDDLLERYIEKPVISYRVSMGINVLRREAVELIPAGARFDMPQLMSALREAGHPVYCHQPECYWQDIGRFDDYQAASEDFMRNPSRFVRELDPA